MGLVGGRRARLEALPCPQQGRPAPSALPLLSTHPAPPARVHPFSAQLGAHAGQRHRRYPRWCQPTERGSGGSLPRGKGLYVTLSLEVRWSQVT